MREGEAGKSFVVCRENAVALGDDDTTTTLCDASLCLGLIFFYQLLLSCCCCPDDCVKYFSIHCDFLQKSYSRDDKYCLALHTAFDTVENVTRIGRQTQINLKNGVPFQDIQNGLNRNVLFDHLVKYIA